MTFARCISAALMVAWSQLPAAAQQTTEEMVDAFKTQKEVFRGLREDPTGEATRSITLTPIDPAAEAGTPASPEPAPTVLTLESADEPLPTGLQVNLDKAAQVNVQIRFGFDSFVLDTDAQGALKTVCAAILGADVGQLRIIGHTDATGDARYNQDLSLQRAQAVQAFFVDQCGIDAARLQAVGVGEQFPADSADPFADQNRRVEFQAVS